MKLGFFMMPLHPPEKSRTECFEEDVEFVVHADELGFTEGWIGQHHTLEWEPIPSNDVFIAYCLPQTKNIRLGSGVSIIPQHHPVNIAVRLAFLDHLARGRFNCGFGQGGTPTDWGLFDLPDPKTQGLMTLEGIDMILKLWQTDPPFDFRGKFWHIKVENSNHELKMGTLLKPYQKPHPPIGMSVIRGESKAARMAGQRGYMPISANLLPSNVLPVQWKTYCEGAREAGRREPDRSIWRVPRSIYIGESNDEAWDHVLSGTFKTSIDYLVGIFTAANVLPLMKADPDMADEDVTTEYFLKKVCIIGDVKSCIRQLEEVWEVSGGFGTLLMTSKDWDDRAKWRRSMELLATKVLPALPTVDAKSA